MKKSSIIAVGFAILLGALTCAQATQASSLEKIEKSIKRNITFEPEMANRKGSHRVGGKNGKGKGSRYVGGRKR